MSDNLWYSAKLAAVQTVKDLNITSGGAADTIGEKVFSQMRVHWTIFPSVVFTTTGQVPRRIGGTARTKLIVLPVVLWIGDSAIQDEREEIYQDWFQQIYEAFDQQKLAGVPEVQDCKIDVTPFLDPRLPEYQHFVMGMALNFEATKQR